MNLTFSGFAVNMFEPFFGSDLLDAVYEKLATGQVTEGAVTSTTASIVTTNGFPSATFTVGASFSDIPENVLDLLLNSVSIVAIASSGATPESMTLTNIRLSLGNFVSLGITQGLYNGNDVIEGGTFSDVLRGYGGNDTVRGGVGADILLGELGDDKLYGGVGNDTLMGGAGVDALDGEAGADEMSGGAGGDTYKVDSLGDAVNETSAGAAGGVDLVQASVNFTLGANIENLTLTGIDDIDGTGNELNNVITVLAGTAHNVLSGLGGNDTLNAGAGDDTLDGGTGNDTMTGGAGNDTYVVDSALDKVIETLADVAGGTADLVQSSVSFILGANVEHLTLTGSTNINATGNTLANTLTGNDGNNVLLGLAGNDALTGGAGNDTLDGGLGIDAMAGGAGDDTYVLDNVGDSVNENLNEGSDTILISGRHIDLNTDFPNIENVTLTGTGAFNLTGDDENNILIGNAAANTLIGGVGNDTLDGGLGIDTLNGGTGDDIYVITTGDTIIDASGNDTVSAAFSLDLNTRPGVENITLLGAVAINATGNGGDNILTGNTAANILTGGLGDDTLDGGAGNDTLDGGTGADMMVGGTGNDTYVVNNAGDTTVEAPGAGGGVDTVLASISLDPLADNIENLTLTGIDDIDGTGNELNNVITVLAGTAHNVLSGLGGNDTLNAGAGDDTLDGGTGNDTMTGGAGNDTYVVDSALDKVIETLADVAGGTADLVQSSVSFILGANVEHLTLTGSTNINATGNTLANTLTGNDGNNVLLGLAGNDALTGGAGNDTLDGGLGIDAMAGGAGDDTYVLDNVGDSVNENLNEGSDTILISGRHIDLNTDFPNIENVTLTGTGAFNLTGDDENNILIGNAAANTLIGGVGNDTLDGGLGIDTLNGGTGDDIYVITTGDTIIDASGNDTVSAAFSLDLNTRPGVENITLLGAVAINATGNGGDNILTGNTAANILTGGLGDDTLDGGAGNDTLDGGTGADMMVGGTGNDTYVVNNAGDTTVEAPGAGGGVDTVLASISLDPLADNIENLTLTGIDDIDGTGNELNNVITVLAGTAHNVLSGLGGNDTLNAGAGDDTLDGGTGNDTMTGGAGNDTYVVDSALDKVIETLADVAGGTADLVQSSVSFILGANVEHLTLTGSTNINATGNTLANTLTGNDGNNVLLGLAGNDALTGGAGNDTLDGGLGIDAMAGGAGDDTYVLDNVGDSVNENLNEGSDTILISGRHIDLNTDFPNIENVTLTGTGAFNLTGDDENNILIGNAAANTLIGGVGNDTLDGGLGIDTLNGGTGDDIYVITTGDTIIDASGNDTVSAAFSLDLNTRPGVENITLLGAVAINATGNGGDNILTGNTAANILTGGLGDDTLDGGAGNDTLDGGTGADMMVGGTGNDTYVVNNAGDTTVEAPGAGGGVDTVLASISLDPLADNIENLTLTGIDDIDGTGNELNNVITVLAGTAHNVLSGLGGNDTLNAGAGDDTLDGGTGNDTMTGGAGNDTYVVDSALDKVIETLADVAGGTADLVQSSVSFILGANVEHLTLTGSTNINATGNTLANTLTGNDGNNVLLGLAGNDALTGGAGNDTLDGGLGIDAMAGGAGDDTYVIDNVGDTVIELSNQGSDTLLVGFRNVDLATAAEFSNIENVTLIGGLGWQLGGNGQNNILIGNSADNFLFGADGDDYLDGGLGNDGMNGGVGNDTYVVNAAGDSIADDPSGNDTVRSTISYDLTDKATIENLVLLGTAVYGIGNSSGNMITGTALDNQLYGQGGNDNLQGAAGNDILYGGDGNDTLDGGEGIDVLLGGDGDDRFIFSDTDDLIIEIEGQGSDTIVIARDVDLRTEFFTLENVELIGTVAQTAIGDAADNRLVGNDQDNTLEGNEGNDVLDGGAGADLMIGGLGDDSYVIRDGEDDVIVELAGHGSDTAIVSRNATLAEFPAFENITLAGFGAYYALGDGNDNQLTGNAGGNQLVGDAGNDTLNGNDGNDSLEGGAGNDTLSGGNGDDLLEGDSENDYLDGGQGNDELYGGEGDDTLVGATGDDLLDGGLGIDHMDGGAGNDIYVISESGDSVEEQSGTGSGIDTIRSPFNVDINTPGSGIENLELLGSDPVSARGNSRDNVITGNDGDNQLFGAGGNDTLNGGAGNDVLQGANSGPLTASETNTMHGGIGNDTYILNPDSDEIAIIVELPGEGTDTVRTGRNIDLSVGFDNVENAILDSFNDPTTATGNTLSNQLTGNELANTLDGLGGNDTLIGNQGNDFLFGRDGDDTLIGGLGSDTMLGESGDDRFFFDSTDLATGNIAGGTGNDTLVFSSFDLDLGTTSIARLSGIDTFDLTGANFDNNELSFTSQHVLDFSDAGRFYVYGNMFDNVRFQDQGWVQGANEQIGNIQYETYTLGQASVYVDTDLAVVFT